MKRSICLALLLLFVPGWAWATSYAWSHATSNADLTTAYTPNGTPGAGDTLSIGAGANPPGSGT